MKKLNKTMVLRLAIIVVVFIDVWVLFLVKKEFMKNPLISVVVTSYNYEEYIKKALDSILEQRYKNYEVIIVDDGSTDKSVEIISEYTKKYDNFHLYQHINATNKGLPSSLKLGVEKSSGKYISFLESDDYWHQDTLLKRVEMINKHRDAVIISNNIISFGNDQKSLQQAYFFQNYINSILEEKNVFEVKNDLFSIIPTFSSVMIKRDILNRLDFDSPIPSYLDVYLYKQILKKYPLYYIKHKLTFWRRHKQSLNSFDNQKKEDKDIDKFKEKLGKLLE